MTTRPQRSFCTTTTTTRRTLSGTTMDDSTPSFEMSLSNLRRRAHAHGIAEYNGTMSLDRLFLTPNAHQHIPPQERQAFLLSALEDALAIVYDEEEEVEEEGEEDEATTSSGRSDSQ